MILEALKELGQMIQGHPEAQSERAEEIANLKRSINNLTAIKANQAYQGLTDPHTELSLKQQKTRLAQLTGEDF